MDRMQRPSSKSKSKTPKRSTSKNPVEEPESEPVISHGPNRYHLGTEIGRGGFAVVFQAFNAHTGQTVAVKRFPISAIAGKDSQISVELAEIELMHELDHPNIVKYYDTVKTKSYLYIVLEYMENGSLVNLIKKFGCFSEALTAIYIMQVLRGLKYLHDQGVLHRDIKGANILTSKDGMVKLADFGVAMKMNEGGTGHSASGVEDGPDLAGSPYWMAPEIIEMSTPTSACDIWSVGCVVIELLTSKPPYFDLDPMPALFRIVSDDYPPFPEGISQALKDFLLQCFHKEPTMRSSAEKLLAHPWLSNSSSKRSLVQTSEMLKSRSIDAGDSSVGQSTEVIQSAIRMYERNLHTIPEAEHELDSDRSRSGRRPDPPGSVPGAATSARSSARTNISSARSEAPDPSTDASSVAAAALVVESASDDPPMATILEDSTWRSVPLSGSTSLPGSAGSASCSHSRSHSDGTLQAATHATYDAGFAISAESMRSSVGSFRLSAESFTNDLTPSEINARVDTEPSIELGDTVKGSPLTFKTEPTARSRAKLELLTASEDAGNEEASTHKPRSGGAELASTFSATSASSSFLQGMKFMSMDSFEVEDTNWDIDMSVSRDSTEEFNVAPKPSLLRSALGVAKLSPSRNLVNKPTGPKAPCVINLNSPTMSFHSNTSPPPPSSAPAVSAAVAAAFSKASGAVQDSSDFMDDFDDEDQSDPEPPLLPLPSPAKRMNVPMIKIPTLSLQQASTSASSTLKLYVGGGKAGHNSAVDLGKYQESGDDDFDDFVEGPDSGPISARSTPRLSPRKQGKAQVGKGKGGFFGAPAAPSSHSHTSPLQHRTSAHQLSGDDGDLDGAFEGDGFDDKIRAYKTGTRHGPAARDAEPLSSRRAGTDETGALLSPKSGGGGSAVLANKLRKRIQQVTAKEPDDEDLDAFLNYQYDEKDFKQNEAKDLHFRRSREIVEIMNCIRQEIKTKEIIDLSNQLLTIFSEVPEQRDHLITHHGVMPIVDMFDARCSSANFRVGTSSAKSTKALHVLKVVNKIIDGNVKAKEQLSLVGIIPTVMNLFESSFKQSIYHQNVPQAPNALPFVAAVFSSSTSTDSTGDNTLAQPGISLGDPRPPLAPHFAMREDIDPVTLEAARFIHQICSTSSLTLQMLIGAGGLSVLTGMVSLGATLNPSLFGQDAMNTALASVSVSQSIGTPNHHNSFITTPRSQSAAVALVATGVRSISGSASPSSAALDARSNLHGIATIATFSTDFADVVSPVTDQQLADDFFFNPAPRTSSAPNATESEELMTRMQIFQMGVDCVSEVFSMKSSRSRDFCRLFVKLGLLHPLSLSFQNVMAMYRARQASVANAPMLFAGTLPTGETASSSSTGATPREQSKGGGNGVQLIPSQQQQHRRDGSGTTQASPRHRRDSSGGSSGGPGSFFMHSGLQEAEESAECKYALRMASLLFTFSRSDAIVAETMVKAEHGVLLTLLNILQAPELRALSGGRTTPLAGAAAGKSDIPLSSASLSAHNASHSNSSPSLFKRQQVQLLLPTYVEIVDLLLKCLKNLSMEPSALADLEAAGTLETLVPLLCGPISDRCRNHILPCIFNMCRINKRRQERVAVLGIVPHLKKVILDVSPLRQFALPVLFDLAHTSAATRAELGKWNCQPFFLDLLKENYWQAFALNSLAVWLSSEPESVVGMLIEPAHLTKLIEFFKAAQSQTIQTLHRPLLDMMLKSTELCQALGRSVQFTHVLVKRLRETDEAIVLRSLLKMLQLMREAHLAPREWVEANNLISVVEEFAKSEQKVLVRQLAKKLLLDFSAGGLAEKS